MNERQDWQDCAKGIGIVLVVLGHVMRGMEAGGLLHPGTALKLFDYGMYLFHMPLFFFLSGLNVERSLTKGKLRFLCDRAWTIAYPYFLWSVIQGLVRVNLANDVNVPVGYDHLLTIFWEPVSQFWFLYALMLCHLCAVVFGLSLPALAALAAAALCVTTFAPYPLEKFTYNLPFYLAGVAMSGRLAQTMSDRKTGLFWIAPTAGLFAISATLNASAFGLRYEIPPAIVAGFAGVAMTVAISGALQGGARTFTVWLGRMSMTIYILHILAGAGTRIVLLKLGVRDSLLHVVVGTFAGVFLPVLAHYFFDRFNLLGPLGLKALKRPAGSSAAKINAAVRS